METLTKKLQTYGACAHYPQQRLPLHGYLKFELLLDLLGPKLFRYYFQIDYGQSKANRVADAFSFFLKETKMKKKALS